MRMGGCLSLEQSNQISRYVRRHFGFRSGVQSVGDFFVPVGYCEIDPFARQAYEAIYDTKGELFFEDARKIDTHSLPDIDLICGGFPCQSFSIAGKRGGFEDARGTLFFEIARIARVKRPKYLLLENVPGLLSHDSGRTFATILVTLSELGYDVAWQVLNSADFGVPQSRKRVFLICCLGEECAGEILYFTESNPKTIVQKLDYKGNLTCTYPDYNGGWEVTAYPSGRIIDQKTGKEYSYLFWEGVTDVEYDFSRGFVVKGEDTAEFLQKTLAEIGLTPVEYNEFIVYWLPRMQNKPYNLISFQSDIYTESAKLEISPSPDSLLRVFMAYRPLSAPIDIEPQAFDTFVRQGFTVVEWGGTEIR